VPAPQRSRRRSTPSPGSTRPSKATSTTATERPLAKRFHFVGGKGGVGKTTCAAAIAAAAAAAGTSTLVVSTDPAPSLGDALRLALSHQPRRVPAKGAALYAVEIDAGQALDRWLASRRAALERIALRGTWLDAEDVSKLLTLSLPGIDEVAALIEINRLAADPRFQFIVIDTAPTGHTLRMLAMPETLQRIAHAFDRMQMKHRVISEALTGGYIGDDTDALIAEIDAEGRSLDALLRNPEATRVSWVSLPELMSVDETWSAATSLANAKIPLADLIVNRVTPPPPQACRWCDGRRVLEYQAMAELRARLPRMTTIEVAARVPEPVGVRTLQTIGREIADVRRSALPRVAKSRVIRPYVPDAPTTRSRTDGIFGLGSLRLVLFGGKGGVGKTTCATAAALRLAGVPRKTVLLLSADPAHSLADVLGQPVDDTPRHVRGAPSGLRVREIDAPRVLERMRTRYARSIDVLFDRIVAGATSGAMRVDVTSDREAMHGLIELAPPGIDELAAVIDVVEAIRSEAVDTIVIDTAPTGHALRLLEMPELVHDWTKALMAILLKYQPIAGLEEFAPMLVSLSQGLGRLRAMLTDRVNTGFVVVTRAAALPLEETHDLVGRLDRLQVSVPAVVVNAVGRGTCTRCQSEARIEQRHVRRLAREIPRHAAMVIAPARLPPPHGSAALTQWQQLWRVNRARRLPQ
jgi:arsenite/tail-anchored protein-transporting ATPase